MDELPCIQADALDDSMGIAGFVDVETTGLSAETDEIVEFCIVLFAFRRDTGLITGILNTYIGLREPSVPINPAASRVNGIVPAMVRGKQLDHGRIETMIQRAEFLVAHNSGFDRSFVEQIFPVAATKKWYCSMKGIDWAGKGFTSRSLQSLLRAHDLSPGKAHRADHDATAALRLLCQCGPDGTTYFRELMNGKPARRQPRKTKKDIAAAPERTFRPRPTPKESIPKPTGCSTGCAIMAFVLVGIIFVFIYSLT